MATDTLDDFSVTNTWQDIVATTAGAGSADLILQNLGTTVVAVVQGGVSPPPEAKSGRRVNPGDDLYVNNAHLWVKSFGPKGLLGLNPL